MEGEKALLIFRCLLNVIREQYPINYADLIVDTFVSEVIFEALAENMHQRKGAVPEISSQKHTYACIESQGFIKEDNNSMFEEAVIEEGNNHCVSLYKADEEFEESKMALKRKRKDTPPPPPPRKNRQFILNDLNTDQVKEAAEKLKSPDMFKNNMIQPTDTTLYAFTTDTAMLEKCIPRTCIAYISNTKMVFLAEVARAVSAITYYLQMETLKKAGQKYHKNMLDALKSIMTSSELARLKVLGKRMYRLTQVCGLASLAVLACVSCGRIIECTNNVFDVFVETAQEHLDGGMLIDFNDIHLTHFKEFYRKSINYI